MSSGKFCCKSWRKLLVPGTCPTPLLEVNYCFSCTAKNTCASIPAAPAHSPTPSSAPASSSHQTAPRHGLCSSFAPLSSSRLGGRPHTPAALAAGLMAAGLFLCPSWLFQVRGLPATSRGATAWHNVKGILLPCEGKILRFLSIYLQICTVHVVWVGRFPFSMELMWCKGERTGWGPGRSDFCSQIGTILPEGCNQTLSLLSALASLSITREPASF